MTLSVALAAGALSRTRAEEPAKAVSSPKVCVQVRIGTERSSDFSCLNAALEELAEKASARQAGLANVAASSTSLAPTQVGLVNITAVKERLGTNFGHSPFPQRPTITPNVPLLH